MKHQGINNNINNLAQVLTVLKSPPSDNTITLYSAPAVNLPPHMSTSCTINPQQTLGINQPQFTVVNAQLPQPRNLQNVVILNGQIPTVITGSKPLIRPPQESVIQVSLL